MIPYISCKDIPGSWVENGLKAVKNESTKTNKKTANNNSVRSNGDLVAVKIGEK